MMPAQHSNEILDRPRFNTEAHFIYREAAWVDKLLRAILFVFGFGFGALAVWSLERQPVMLAALCMIASGSLMYGAFFLRRTAGSVLFVCSHAGLYFPECRVFGRRSGAWLFVPWHNVQDYRVQPLLDETSCAGIVMSLHAAINEQSRFLLARSLYRKACGTVMTVGFTTLWPRPQDVLVQMRRYDALCNARHGQEEALSEADGLLVSSWLG